MKLTIDIDAAEESTVIQSVALAKGWTLANDDQGRSLLGADLCTYISNLAANGEVIRKRQAELVAIKQSTTKVVFT